MKWLPNRETLSRNGHASGCELILYPCLWRCHRVSLLSLDKSSSSSGSRMRRYNHVGTSLRISLHCTLDLCSCVVLRATKQNYSVTSVGYIQLCVHSSDCPSGSPFRSKLCAMTVAHLGPLLRWVGHCLISVHWAYLWYLLCVRVHKHPALSTAHRIYLLYYSFIHLFGCHKRSCTSPLLHPHPQS